MAKAREIKRRIRSIGSTKKITRTMEMVATAKSKVTQNRLKTLLPYSEDLVEMSAGLVGSFTHPLLLPREEVKKVAILVLTSNRGLCGGYNTGISMLGRDVVGREKEAGREVELHVSGKKGISFFKRRKFDIAESYTHFEDRPTFAQADGLARSFLKRYIEGDLDRVILIYSRYHSAGDQRPGEIVLLPLEREEKEEKPERAAVDYIYEPDPQSILEALLPLSVSVGLLKALAESAACEQIARRVAMKLATDNAEDLLKFLTRRYNRARQAQITNELSEIMGGAEALK